MSPDLSIDDLPADLRAAYEAATSLVGLMVRILDHLGPACESSPQPGGQPTRDELIQSVAAALIQLAERFDDAGEAIEDVSEEIAAANRDPFPLGEDWTVEPNAHEAVLTCAESVIERVYLGLREHMPKRYGGEVPEGGLPPRLRLPDLVRHYQQLAEELRHDTWPDWEELCQQLATEVSTTARARRGAPRPRAPAATQSRPHTARSRPRRVRPPDKGREARARWIYRQYVKSDKTLKGIMFELNAMAQARRWDEIHSVQGIQQAADRYAKRKGLDPMTRRL